MNKILIILLATCLLSVHAFVKRDAPAAPTESASQFDAIKNNADQLFKAAQAVLQENFEKAQKIAQEAVEKLKAVTDTGKKGENAPAA